MCFIVMCCHGGLAANMSCSVASSATMSEFQSKTVCGPIVRGRLVNVSHGHTQIVLWLLKSVSLLTNTSVMQRRSNHMYQTRQGSLCVLMLASRHDCPDDRNDIGHQPQCATFLDVRLSPPCWHDREVYKVSSILVETWHCLTHKDYSQQTTNKALNHKLINKWVNIFEMNC